MSTNVPNVDVRFCITLHIFNVNTWSAHDLSFLKPFCLSIMTLFSSRKKSNGVLIHKCNTWPPQTLSLFLYSLTVLCVLGDMVNKCFPPLLWYFSCLKTQLKTFLENVYGCIVLVDFIIHLVEPWGLSFFWIEFNSATSSLIIILFSSLFGSYEGFDMLSSTDCFCCRHLL